MLSSRITKVFVLFLGLLFPFAAPVVPPPPRIYGPSPVAISGTSAMRFSPATVTASRLTAP